jgi:hypothetical protein
VRRALDSNTAAAEAVLARASSQGLDVEAITSELERDGVRAFCDSYAQIERRIETKVGVLAPAA